MKAEEAGVNGAPEPTDAHDVFISYAGEDRKLARRLKKELERRDLTVWFAETELVAGQSLRRSIDRGLARSRAGAVILSPNFFGKAWPQAELDGLMTREKEEPGILIPIWHRVEFATVREYSLTLADKYALKTSDGVRAVADGIVRALEMLAAGASPDATREAVAAEAAEQRPSSGSRSGRMREAITRYGEDVWTAMGVPQVAYLAMILGTVALAFAGELLAAALLVGVALLWPLIFRRERLRVALSALSALALIALVAAGYSLVRDSRGTEERSLPADSYSRAVSSALGTLDGQRRRHLGALQSRSPAKRADAASALADAHQSASRRLRGLNTPLDMRGRLRSLIATLDGIADDLDALARAARKRDRGVANKGLARALRRDADLRDQLDDLRAALSAR